jgi:predicted helicase
MKRKTNLDQYLEEQLKNEDFADYKEQVIDLLQRVCTVSVETVNIIRKMI